MLLHEFGKENKKTIVMIHGLAMSWDIFLNTIKELENEFHIFAVAVPGFDLDSNNEFTSVENVCSQIEDALIKEGFGEIDILYGLSMGGGIAIRMLADNQIDFKNAIIDAGITPYEMPYIFTRFMLVKDVCTTILGKYSYLLLKLAFPTSKYTETVTRTMYQVLQHMTIRTCVNAYDSTDNYKMPDQFPHIETKIHYWYGANEKKERKLDLLDCGCGTGPMSSLLSEKYPDRQYTGLDLTPKMIEVAK